MLRLYDDPLANIRGLPRQSQGSIDHSERILSPIRLCIWYKHGPCQHAEIIVGYTPKKETTTTHAETAQGQAVSLTTLLKTRGL